MSNLILIASILVSAISWALSFIEPKKRRLTWTALTTMATITILVVGHFRKENLSRDVNRISIENTNLKKGQDSSNQKINQLKIENGDLSVKIKVAEEMAYQEYALYDVTGRKNSGGIAAFAPGIRLYIPTPLTDWNKGFFSRSEIE